MASRSSPRGRALAARSHTGSRAAHNIGRPDRLPDQCAALPNTRVAGPARPRGPARSSAAIAQMTAAIRRRKFYAASIVIGRSLLPSADPAVARRGKIILNHFVAQMPLAGIAWQAINYVAGL